ncbi:MAG: hypothetical protein JSS09_03070 [Verrucomicrobia bacterium]|nr:hypothetical protein [Verrucomicrobiota bacterium]
MITNYEKVFQSILISHNKECDEVNKPWEGFRTTISTNYPHRFGKKGLDSLIHYNSDSLISLEEFDRLTFELKNRNISVRTYCSKIDYRILWTKAIRGKDYQINQDFNPMHDQN